VNHSKVVAEQFLGPSIDDMDWSVIFEDLFDGAAITKPRKESSPQEFLVLRDSPTATGRFTNEKMEVTFLLSTFPRIEADRTQTGAAHGGIEIPDAILEEACGSSDGSWTIVWLHEDGTETLGASIGFQENGLDTIVSC
jgi:hypothetical protein